MFTPQGEPAKRNVPGEMVLVKVMNIFVDRGNNGNLPASLPQAPDQREPKIVDIPGGIIDNRYFFSHSKAAALEGGGLASVFIAPGGRRFSVDDHVQQRQDDKDVDDVHWPSAGLMSGGRLK
jgi:hypothetical protein